MTSPSLAEAATDQLTAELAAAAARWIPIVGLRDGTALENAARGRAPMLAAQLAGDDDTVAAETVVDVLMLLWPHGDPEDHSPGWWRTPVGRLCARSLGRRDAEEVTHSVAAAMLGISRGAVSTMVHRGTLDRHPDGGVLRASVLQRIARDL